MTGTQEVAVEKIVPNPRNPRENFSDEKIDELAESIDEKGLLQAVLVRPVGDGFELVHGERRLRAVQSLNRDTIKAEVRDLDDGEALEVAITENLQREDVTPIAEARAYQQLIDEFDITQGEAADRLGISQSKISNQLRLLDMPEVLQRDILHKIFSPWQARVIASNWGEYDLRDKAIDLDLSVSELRDVVSQLDDGREFIRVGRNIGVEDLEDHVVDDWQEWYDDHGVPEEDRTAPGVAPHMNFRLWAQQNISDFDKETMYQRGRRDEPLLAEVKRPKLPYPDGRLCGFGNTLVREALRHGYRGDVAVEIVFPRSFFKWPSYDREALMAEQGVADD